MNARTKQNHTTKLRVAGSLLERRSWGITTLHHYKRISSRDLGWHRRETTPDANDKAMYGLKQITAKYNHAKDQLEYTRLYAPFSGYVQKRLFDSHETIAAGMPVVSIISEGTPEVEINLFQFHILPVTLLI